MTYKIVTSKNVYREVCKEQEILQEFNSGVICSKFAFLFNDNVKLDRKSIVELINALLTEEEKIIEGGAK